MESMEVHRDGPFCDLLKIPKREYHFDQTLDLVSSRARGSDPVAKGKRKRSTYCPPAEQAPKRNKIRPLIIHSVCPPLIHAEPSNFMQIVQSLTGCALTRLRCEEFNKGNGASPTSTICQAASSPCTSTSTDEQHEASFLGLVHQASSCSPAADKAPQRLISLKEPFCDQDVRNLQRNFSMGANKAEDHEASSSAVMMSSYEGEHEGSSTSRFISRHGELEVSCASPFMSNYGGEQEISSSAACKLQGNFGLFGDDPLFLLDCKVSEDSYLEHLLLSYDHNVPCKYTSSTSMLADVGDPSLLRDLL